ncbi:HNH endonuclease [Embleya scabrispora]|uniref:HNH endonuclease n=1 Tax=Embleya scabrispora TaxID=159449 RepID=UPI001F3C2519|nr:SAVED domain-containing protein [Embleya scabrispora]
MAVSETERLKAWVRAGGRCELCGAYLLEGKLTYREFRLGELAHIVGQDTAPGSPRGGDPLPVDQRDLAENLMLLCRGEHDEIDRRGSLDLVTVERLRQIKREREEWIRRVTGLNPTDGTVVIRLIGSVRGQEVELTKATTAEAVIRSEGRFPEFPLSLHGDGFEVDLRQVVGEERGEPAYWQQCRRRINQVLEYRLAEAVRQDSVRHVSVFGFARLPLLVYFGSRLDDTFAVTIYQRHRSTEAWTWPETLTAPADFSVEAMPGAQKQATEGLLLLNISGSIQEAELPSDLQDLPRWRVSPHGVTPSVDVVNSVDTLNAYSSTLRSLMSDLEARHKHIRRLHVLAAAPVSAAVALGRLHDANVHPVLVIYDRSDGRYNAAMEIP